MMGQAEQTVSTHVESETGAAQIAKAQQTGDIELTPEQQATAAAEMAKSMPEGTPPKDIWDKINDMSWPEKLGLGLGLGAGVMGLVQAMTGGGMGSWLMGLLGMGGAAMLAGNAGLLGQDAQGMTQGLTDTVTNGFSGLFGPGESGEQTPPASLGSVAGFDITPERVETALPYLMKLPESMKVNALKALGTSHPGLAKQLNQASGANGHGLTSFLGDMTNETNRRMSAAGIKGNENQQELLRLWQLAQK